MRPVAILFGLVIGVTACAIGWTLIRDRRRRSQMAEAATALGLRPVADPERWLHDTGLSRLPLFALAELGARVRISSVFEGNLGGTSIAVCDYTRVSGSGNNRFDVRETVACLPLQGSRPPAFVLVPAARGLGRVGAAPALGMFRAASWLAPPPYREAIGALRASLEDPGVPFEDDPEFAARYRVSSPDPIRAKEILTPALRHLLWSLNDQPPAIQSNGSWLIFFRPHRIVPPGRLRAFLDQAAGVERLLGR